MTIKVDCPRYWRTRAEKARTTALAMTDPVARTALLHVADGYERLAERAERREQMGAADSR